MIDAYITTKTDLTNGWSALESIFEHYLDYIIDNNKNLIPIQEVMPIIGWNELEKISLEYITGKVNAIVSKLIQENQLKAYDDDVLKNLLNGWFMQFTYTASQPGTHQKIIDMAMNGVGCRATARIMGVGLNTILRHLKNSGRSR